jgi:carbamoyl-phosphate synthase small subunit
MNEQANLTCAASLLLSFHRLVLEDGSSFKGFSFGARENCTGEMCFNTGMVGYCESLTDPSYRGQILIITYPEIGNYGVPNDDIDEYGLSKHFESAAVQVSGLVVANYSTVYSHYQARRSLGDWLKEFNKPGIFGIDTRLLTKKLRTAGAMLGKIVFQQDLISNVNFPLVDPNKRNLVAEVSCKQPKTYGRGKIKILAIDCGMKYNIIRYFIKRGVEFKVVPYDYDIENENYDGLFLSNGPGDPTMVSIAIPLAFITCNSLLR